MSEVISLVLERTGLPAALADSEFTVESLCAEQRMSPEQVVDQIAYAHFLFWWAGCLSRFKPGTAVSTMWKAYPHGAMLADSDWCWWSLERVARDGTALAHELGVEGLVIAEGRQGAAVLHWPGHQVNTAVLLMVPFATGGNVDRTAVDPSRFIASKGFDDAHRVIPCALLGRPEPARAVTPFRMTAPAPETAQDSHSALVCSSNATWRTPRRVLKKTCN